MAAKPGFKPRAAGWEARMLLCTTQPPIISNVYLLSRRWSISQSFFQKLTADLNQNN